MSKTFKSITKAVSKVIPKVTMDPGKAVGKLTEGVTNIQKDILVKPAVDLASAAVGGVGQVMSQPGAGAVLGGVGAAFGIPSLGNLGGLFGNGSAAATPSSQSPIIVSAPSSEPSKDNTTMMIVIGGGFAVLVMVLVLTMRRGK